MSKTMRAVVAIFWLLVTLACVFLGFFGFLGHDNSGNHMYGLGVVGFLLAAGTSFFVYHDYQFFFGKKS
jgi:hypothetical protein